MKNFKRVFSLALAFCMLFSMAETSFAAKFTDVPETHKNAEAIELLTGLGILVGYDTGDFKPEGTITRAEAAAVIVRVIGCEDEAKKGQTIFSDVEAGSWYSGYINTAVAHGILNGFPDGTFKPMEPVTYEQIIKMVVCAIGHDVKAKTLSEVAYPDGFIRAASEARITKGISGYVGMPADRALVAQIVYNALEVEMMEATSYSTGSLGIAYSYNGRTILRDYLEIEKVDAVVRDTYLTGETYSKRDEYIQLEISKVYSLNSRASRLLYSAGDVVNFEEGDSDAHIYLGKAITAYVGEDRETGEDTIFAVTVDPGKTNEVEVTKDRFSEKESSDKVIAYAKRITDKKSTELELDRNVTVVENGQIVNKSIEEYFDEFDVMTLVDNNRDNKYDFVFVSVFDESEGVEFVVTDIEKEGKYYYCFEGDNGEIELDYENDDLVITVILDGKVASAGDIKKGDVITCLDASRSIMTVYVSSESVKGSVSEVDYVENEYYIGSKAYELSPAFSEELEPGDYGTFYINYQGKIAYSTVQSKVTGGDYIFITDYDQETKFSKTTYLIQAVDEDGSVETYTLKSTKMRYVDAHGSVYKNATAKEVHDYLTFERTELSGVYGVKGYVGIARVKASSAGVISEIYIPGNYEEFYAQTKYATDNGKEYSARRGTYGSYDISGKEVTFRIDDKEDQLTDAIEVGTIKDFFTDGGNYVFVAYGERGEKFDAIVITDGISAVDYQQNAIIVTKTSQIAVGGEKTTKIVGLGANGQVSLTVDPDENFDVEVGNIILVALNGEGYISRMEKVANTTDDIDDLDTAFEDADIPGDEDAGVFGGMVVDKTSKRFSIRDVEESFYNGGEVKYYLIDYTGRETTFEKSSFSAIKTTSSTDSYVVVRTYEGEAVDVFVFRMAAGEVNVPTIDIWDRLLPVEPEKPTTKPTEATEATNAPIDPTEATEATAAPTEPTGATEATAAPTEPTGATEATAAPTEPTGATEATAAPTEPTGATEATAAPTEPTGATEATAAPTEPTGATEATAAPTEPTGATEATAAPTEPTGATEATAAPTEPTGATEATAAPTEPTETTEATAATTASENPTQSGPILAGETKPADTEKKVILSEVMAKEVLKLINAERAKLGLKPLELDNSVVKTAEAHGVDMAKNNYLDQKSKDGSTVEVRLTKGNVKFDKAAENLAKGNYTPQVIVDAWMKSEKHRANIVNGEFNKVGIAVAIAPDGSVYWVVDFVKKADEPNTNQVNQTNQAN